MDTIIDKSAKMLEPIFKAVPPLPKNVNDWFAKAWPIIALIIGVLQLLAAWSLWHVGHLVNAVVNYTNALNNLYGTGVSVNHLGFFYWLSLIFLIVDGIIFIVAFTGLRARRKRGWDMLFLGAIVNVLYGLFTAFDSGYGGPGRFILTLIGSAIGFYFLYQVRSYYTAKGAAAATKTEAPKA
jgi:hypothetical protein